MIDLKLPQYTALETLLGFLILLCEVGVLAALLLGCFLAAVLL
jgi:hypothetical protein